ncbi:MAG: LON peptidase substrate-binding domain-containing protein [Micrococcales bacterium]|nr:LON peptidase substrate-binding domain-containing protein [Micrococcales bacterium]
MQALALFPLGTVLLPGAPLPLQVFEPRYVTMLEDLARDSTEHRSFGVLAIRQGHEVGPGAATDLYAIGCEAVIEGNVIGDQPPFHLLARGGRRFRLDGIDGAAATPYLTGRVTWLEEPAGADRALSGLAIRVRAAHAAYASALGATPRELPRLPDSDLAYRVVEHTAFPLGDRQRVLEGASARDRMVRVLHILRRETALLTQLRAVPGIPDPGQSSPN